MKAQIITFVLALSISTYAIAGKNTPHDKTTFIEYTSSSYFINPSDLTYSERRGIGFKIEQGLRAGKYVAKYQDNDGYYFIGPSFAVCQGTPKCIKFDLDGGIWISKKSMEDIRLFMIQDVPKSKESDSTHANDSSATLTNAKIIPGAVGAALGWGIVNMLAAKDIGKFFIFPLNTEFATKMMSATQSDTLGSVP